MFKYSILKATALFFFLNGSVYAISCVSGFCGDINVSIVDSLSSSENSTGQIKESSILTTGTAELTFGSNEGPNYAEWFVFPGGAVPAFNTGGPHYNSFYKVDDYISVGVYYKSNCGSEWEAPFNIPVLVQGSCHFAGSYAGISTTWFPRQFRAILRIDKPIISGVYNKRLFLGEYGLCWANIAAGGSCAFKGATIYKMYVDLNITAPQSCSLDAGQVINIDFGNISSGAFKNTGAIAQGVQPQSRSISVKCDNIAGNAQLQMRLQADQGKVSGQNVVVADENNDVGFRVTNNSGTPLRVNDITSYIPFTLDNNARQNVTIQVYPVSVTGNKPAEGPVTSRAYLRVDFP
ncbi:fimbrial protein (plasmid) [Providencia rettgeri]|uniref:fimbrial protein n=1 Tax=Providencia rettgeri TaxID=587 RepID=UPI001CA60E8A|nr:fimbrial protein [Providencia rettgeri]